MFLEKMGIYGISKIEPAILAGLVNGDPVLLIGTHGTAKTTLCRRLAEALSLEYFAYDASKAMFEDMIGFPDPSSITKGEIKYIPTPLSIWSREFILVDEISRARAEMQNKWLEIIRGKQVMGLKAEKLKYVFAAMNPLNYAGSYPLDEALAGRFAFIIKVPELSEMNSEDALKIINNRTEEDGSALDNSGAVKFKKSGVAGFIEKCRRHLNNPVLQSMCADYTLSIIKFGRGAGVKTDGRRAGMLKRNCAAYLAVMYEAEKIKKFTKEECAPHLQECLLSSVPEPAFDAEFRPDKYLYCHDMTVMPGASVACLDSLKMAKPEDAVKITDEIMNSSYSLFRQSVNTLISTVSGDSADCTARFEAIDCLRVLCGKISAGVLNPNNAESERIFDAYARVYDMSSRSNYKFSGIRHITRACEMAETEVSNESAAASKESIYLYRDKHNDHVDFSRVKSAMLTRVMTKKEETA
ncbi:MAG TPA: MoxR family ATPase [Candidatus Goldiibacteriota bacterium]|nr:MoxR family ATPase [Candidatus Goldiibacteriota bacterium]